MRAYITIRLYALVLTLRRLPGVYRTERGLEYARRGFLEDLRRGYTPEQSFRLTMQAGGHAPGSQLYDDMRATVEGWARDAGVGWSEVMG